MKNKAFAQESMAREIAVVNFAGGGGSDDGIERYTTLMVGAAINHDPAAILMHKTNHPYTEHLQEDVFMVDPPSVCRGRPVGLAWFSPDCTHFSRAKGGTPVKKEIRGLSWVIVRWAMTVRPRVILMENVKEIRTWGPLMERDGGLYPDPDHKGETFAGFVAIMTDGIAPDHPALLECCAFLQIDPAGAEAQRLVHGLGYDMEWKELRAADYGVPTVRERFFGAFRCDGQPIRWPEPTHAPRDSEEVRRGEKKPWLGAHTVIDWSLPAPSIFDTKQDIKARYGVNAIRPLADNTMRRIARGLDKFVLQAEKPFIVEVNHAGEFRGQDIADPLNTITAKHGRGVVVPSLVQCKFDNAPEDVKEPIRTLTSVNAHLLATPFLTQYHQEQREDVRGQMVDKPVLTIDTANRYAVAVPAMVKYYGNDRHGQDSAEPLHTVTARDREGIMQVAFTQVCHAVGYHGKGNTPGMPVNTITGTGGVTLDVAHICKFKGQDLGQHPKTPLHTVTASWGEFAVIKSRVARYLPGEDLGRWPQVRDLLNTWCGYTLAEDEVLLLSIGGVWWFICDVGLRMLTAREAFSAMGFARDYIIDRDYLGREYPKSEQMKRCGNAVCPPLAGLLAAANLPEYARRKPLETLDEWRREVAV